MTKKLYIYSADGHAKVVAAAARLCGWYIAGFWEDSDMQIGSTFFGSKIISFNSIPQGSTIFVAFGNNEIRLKRGQELQKSFNIPAIIHPSAQISENVTIGAGAFISALCNIDPDCVIGDFCIVNNCANISHDTTIEAGCHICGNAGIAGNVYIGKNTLVGIGAHIIEKVKVGANSIIGSCSTVIRDIPDNVIAVGCPAKVIKTNK